MRRGSKPRYNSYGWRAKTCLIRNLERPDVIKRAKEDGPRRLSLRILPRGLWPLLRRWPREESAFKREATLRELRVWDRGPRDGCKDPGRLGPWAEGHNSPYTPPVGCVHPVEHPEKQGGRMLSCENIPAHRPPSTLPNLWAQTSDSHLRVLRLEVYFLSFPSFCGGTQSQLAGQQA